MGSTNTRVQPEVSDRLFGLPHRNVPHEKTSWNKPGTRVKRVISLLIIVGVVFVVAVVAGVEVAANAMVKEI